MAEIVLDATKEDMLKAAAFVEAELEKLSCPSKTFAQINVAVDELLSNIVNYAYPEGGGKARIVVAGKKPNSVSITFEDWGIAYDPTKKPAPDVALGAEDRPIGGLGIYIVKKTMDSMAYERKDDKNILTIIKTWQ